MSDASWSLSLPNKLNHLLQLVVVDQILTGHHATLPGGHVPGDPEVSKHSNIVLQSLDNVLSINNTLALLPRIQVCGLPHGDPSWPRVSDLASQKHNSSPGAEKQLEKLEKIKLCHYKSNLVPILIIANTVMRRKLNSHIQYSNAARYTSVNRSIKSSLDMNMRTNEFYE